MGRTPGAQNRSPRKLKPPKRIPALRAGERR